MNALRALAEFIAGLWPDPVPLRCGIAVCGGGRLGTGTWWPIDRWTVPAYCGEARAGASFCGRIIANNGIFAGMLPVMYSHRVTIGLTEDAGQPADDRQHYNTAYDNPSATLHLVGNDLTILDMTADRIIEALDRTAHISTEWGEINGIRIAPPSRTVRNDRPRYDVQLKIDMEVIR